MMNWINKAARFVPEARTCVLFFCFLTIISDFICKYTPNAHFSHLFLGTSPLLEILVIAGVLLNSPKATKFAFYVCRIDVIIGFICLFTLPVISVAENATGIHLNLPLVATFHTGFKIEVQSEIEMFYVIVMLGFISTALIGLFLIFDVIKYRCLQHMCHQDEQLRLKQQQAVKV
ncbi:hypothetical protein CAEBREN_00979 [Caenorhabditis brenneri]|uniref:Uncharacterized protein n=1 Tax=Caenorhabditis brenneri TaxID=135651 RepID=G0MGN0_CAEBE|nr:hypothetical protein CAEBREN_00979 [Caenorhabditis brenneri]